VHKPFIALLVAVSLPFGQGRVASAQRLTPDPALSRLPGPALRIADSLRIDLKTARLEPPLNVFPGPKGGLIVYAQWRSVTSFDSLGKRLWSKGHNQDGERRELAEVTAFGWDAKETWVSDAAWSQIALLDEYGNVTKSLELPSWVRPTFSNRKSFPVFESMRVLGRYADGQMLVMPQNSLSITGATGYDQDAAYLLRINEDGIIQRTVAKFPSNRLRRKDDKGQEFVMSNPLNQWLFRVSPDGMRTVLVNVDTTAPKVDTVVVRALNDRGDTLWTQKFGYPAQSFTDTQVDSIARNYWGNDTEYRERRAKHLPRRGIAVWNFVLDVDKSVWLSLRGNNSTRAVIGFDASGKPIGKFLLPARRVVRAANLGALWIGEARGDQRGDLVRYRLTK
jgi:hypothetical protein